VPAVEIYRTPDQGDGVEFSDRDQHAAERVTLPPPQTFSNPRPVIRLTPQATVLPEGAEPQAYRSIVVAKPANEATVRDNNGEVVVSVELDPPLQTRFAHQVQLVLDSSANGEPGASSSFQLAGIDRGTHSLQVLVLGGDGKLLASSPVSVFHLHRKIIRPSKPPPKK
jgi:hypothetical protein